MRTRRRASIVAGAFAAAAAAVGLVAAPSSAAGSVSTPAPVVAPTPPPACSADIIGRGPGEAIGRELRFSYTLAGAQCRTSLYTLIIKNTYNPKQVAVFIKLGDGRSKDVVFDQNLPWTPTQAGGVEGGAGLCVIGVTTLGFGIADVAPDPSDAPCEPLRGGTARAFH